MADEGGGDVEVPRGAHEEPRSLERTPTLRLAFRAPAPATNDVGSEPSRTRLSDPDATPTLPDRGPRRHASGLVPVAEVDQIAATLLAARLLDVRDVHCFAAIDGVRTVREIATFLGFEASEVRRSLDRLESLELVRM